jgi:hypothetical protein
VWSHEGRSPVRLSNADRAALKAAAGAEPVSTWLRRVGLEEAKRRVAARSVGDLLDAARAGGFGLSEAETADLREGDPRGPASVPVTVRAVVDTDVVASSGSTSPGVSTALPCTGGAAAGAAGRR